jgi:hypothetical protein
MTKKAPSTVRIFSVWNHSEKIRPLAPQVTHMDELIAGVLGILVRQTGRLVVWLITFGRWRGELLLKDEGRIYGAAGAISFVRDGQRVITDTGLLFIGIAFYVVLLVAVITCFAQV